MTPHTPQLELLVFRLAQLKLVPLWQQVEGAEQVLPHAPQFVFVDGSTQVAPQPICPCGQHRPLEQA